MKPNIYLDHYLQPLGAYLAAEDVTDIYINRPGEVWQERLGGEIERFDVPALTGTVLLHLAQQVAAISAQGINREHPLLAASLPNGERVQIVIPPATRGEVAIAIRKHVVRGFGLEDYRADGGFVPAVLVAGKDVPAPLRHVDSDADPVDILRGAIRTKRNILISGGTSSGKTTFLNALLREIPAEERLILIEDTPELQPRHDNMVGLVAARSALGEASVSTDDLLGAALRMRPDRIILGEIRGSEAVTFLRAINTGHPGSLTTIHADSPSRAIDQLALLVLQTGTRMQWSDVVQYIRRSLGLIVQIGRSQGRRAVEQIYMVE
nr:P-type DNA transfer ATPase VirB11 [Sphingobium yanoikuyae]